MEIKDLILNYRTQKRLTLKEFGKLLGVSEGVVSRWENGSRSPKADNLVRLKELFAGNMPETAQNPPPLKNGISTVKERYLVDAANEPASKYANEANATGKGEAIFITHHNVMWVPLVTQYAYAGYLDSYQNDTYMEELEKIPFFTDHLGKGNYLAFEVRGDSMDDGSRESICSGDRLLCREVKQDHWRAKLHLNKWTFVIVHKTEGIIIKKIVDHDIAKGVITIHSLNSEYPDQQIELNDVKQLFNVIKFDRKL